MTEPGRTAEIGRVVGWWGEGCDFALKSEDRGIAQESENLEI